MNKGGIARGPQGEVTGPGGPKDDLVGPLLSSQEYVLPYEMVLQEGGGSYDRGIKSLERERMAALKNIRTKLLLRSANARRTPDSISSDENARRVRHGSFEYAQSRKVYKHYTWLWCYSCCRG